MSEQPMILGLAVLAMVVVLAVGCGGDDRAVAPDELGGRVAEAGSGSTIGATESGAGSSGRDAAGLRPVADLDPVAAVAAYDRFLAVRDEVHLDPAGGLVPLEAVADADVLDEVEQFWRRNEAYLGVGRGWLDRSSASNVIGVGVEGGRVVVRDCVEMRQSSQDEVDSPVRFIEQEVVLRPEPAAPDGWFVEEVTVLRSGEIADTGYFSCAPGYHSERIVDAVTTYVDGLRRWKADPEGNVPDEMVVHLSEALRAEVEAAAATQNDINGDRYLSSDEVSHVRMMGGDVGAGGWNFLAEVCTRHPEGEVWTDVASGVGFEAKPAGATTRIGYRVEAVEQGDGSWADRIVDLTPVEYPSPCWEELEADGIRP